MHRWDLVDLDVSVEQSEAVCVLVLPPFVIAAIILRLSGEFCLDICIVCSMTGHVFALGQSRYL